MDHGYRIEGNINGRTLLGLGVGKTDPATGVSEMQVSFEKRIAAAGDHGETEATLRATRRLFINRDNLRRALARLLQAALEARETRWWGRGTACASDSKNSDRGQAIS